MFNNIYKNRKVLVTGATGFKGSWLCLWLQMLGAEVIGLSLDIPTKPANFEVLNLAKKIKHYYADVRDYQKVSEIINAERPEIIFHLAAQPIVKTSYIDPVETFSTNAMGTLHVLEVVRNAAFVKVLVLITSDKAYRNVEWLWGYRENDILGGEDPYSASKACAELIAYSYMNSYFKDSKTKVATVRAGNVIGGGDWAEYRIVPDCVKAWANSETVLLRNPSSTRPWQHVLEPLSGYLALGMNLLQGNEKITLESFNFGPDSTVIQPVSELIEKLAQYWPKAVWKLEQTNEKVHAEAGLLKLCCDKALSMLAWRAVLSFDETVELTGNWYCQYYDANPNSKQDMEAFTIDQIKQYSQLASERGLLWAAA